jgi:hypothetical protein
MPPTTKRTNVRWLSFMLFGALAVPSSGCIAAAVTAGVIGAGAAGYVWYEGAVPRDFPADMDRAWSATQLALADLAMPVVTAVRDNDIANIETQTGDGDKVQITLEPRAARVPADGQWTHVTIRVALLGDKPVSERIMNQIDTRLSPPVAAGQHIQPIAAQPQTSAPPLATK